MTVDLDELERLARAATEGPWFLHDFTGPEINSNPTTFDVTVSCVHPDTLTVATMGGGFDGHTGLDQARRDACFIVAVNPIPILEIIARLREDDKKIDEAITIMKRAEVEIRRQYENTVAMLNLVQEANARHDVEGAEEEKAEVAERGAMLNDITSFISRHGGGIDS